MEDYELKSVLSSLIQNSIGRSGDTISNDRADNLKRYHAMPYGDEKPGRSQVLTTECRDTIMWLLPSIMKTFLSTDKIVEFLPTSAGKEGEAEQQTDFINYLVMQENDSFSLFHNWFMDALQCKNGYVKYGFEIIDTVKEEIYTGIDEMGLIKLMENPECEITEVEEEPTNMDLPNGAGTVIPCYNIKLIRTMSKPRYYIENIPPERVLVDSRASNVDDAKFIGVVYYKSRSDLIKMGYEQDLVNSLPSTSAVASSMETSTRNTVNGIFDSFNYDLIEIIEAYVRIDTNNDGIDELHRFVVCGENALTILSDDIVDDIPVVPIAPFLKPHSFFGNSMVDYTKDIQRINTTLWRQILDYIYLANNPMWEVEENSITNMNDALRRTPGGLVRTRRTGSITPIVTTPLQPEAFGLLDRLKDMKDRRTGVMEINQGLNPNAINKTATGVIETMDAGRQLQDLIVRVFAETGVKRLFKGLYGLVIKHQDMPRTIRLRNKWLTIDPSTWDENIDVMINVGLGTASNTIRLAQLEKILLHQKEMMAMGMVAPQHIYNTMAKIISVSGYKDIDAFLMNPAALPQQKPKQPKPSMEELALIEAQANKEKAQMDARIKILDIETKAQLEVMKNQTNYELKLKELETKKEQSNV